MDSVTFASRSILRSKLRSLGLFLGVLLPVALISGVSTSIDNTELSRLKVVLNTKAADLTLSPSVTGLEPEALLTTLSEYGAELSANPLVGSAIPVVEIVLYGLLSLHGPATPDGIEPGGGKGLTTIRLLGLPQSIAPSDASLIGIDSFTGVLPRGCLIDRDTAVEWALSEGDNVTLARRCGGTGELSEELELQVQGVVDLDDLVRHTVARFRANFPSGQYDSPTVIISLDFLPEAAETLLAQIQPYDPRRHSPGARILVFLDRQELFRSSNTQSVKDQITELEDSIASQTEIDLVVDNGALGLLLRAEADSQDMREQFVALSLPLLALSLYIGLVSGENILAMRKREIVLLRVRGLRARRVLRLILLETVLIGVVASCLGVLVGWATSALFLPAASPAEDMQMAAEPTGNWLNPPSIETMLIALSAGIVVALAPTLGWGRRATGIEPQTRRAGASTGSSDEAASEGRHLGQKIDVLLLCLALGSIASGILVKTGPEVFQVTGIWAMIIQTVAPALYSLQGLVPFFVIIGATRLVVRRDVSIRAVTRSLSPLSGQLGYVVRKAQRSVRGQNWRVSLVVALCLGFGGLVTVSMSSIAWYREAVAPLITGGDLIITDLYEGEVNLTSAYLREQGANLSTSLQVVSFFSEGSFYVIDPDTYPVDQRIKPELRDEISESLLRLKETDRGALIGGQAPAAGETVKKRFYSGDLVNHTTLTSAGSYRVMPGLRDNWLGTRFKSTIVSQQTYERLRAEIPQLRSHPHIRYVIVANLPAGTDLPKIGEAVIALLPDHQWQESDVQIITQASIIPVRRGLSHFVRTELHYLLFAGLLGVTTIIISLLSQTRPIFWSLGARGLRAKRRFLLVCAMGLSPVILGVLMGALTGILAGYLWALQSANPYVPIMPTVVLGSDFLGVLLLSGCVFSGVVLVTSYWFTTRDENRTIIDLSQSLVE